MIEIAALFKTEFALILLGPAQYLGTRGFYPLPFKTDTKSIIYRYIVYARLANCYPDRLRKAAKKSFLVVRPLRP